MTSDDELVEKWQRWMDAISRDLGRSLLRKTLFEDTIGLYKGNPKLQEHGGAFFWFFSGLYVDTIAAGIRRQVKAGEDSITLTRLLRDIARSPSTLSREQYRDHYRKAGQRVDDRVEVEFDRFAAGGPHVDPRLIEDDLTLLSQACDAAEGYVDRRVAHFDRRAPKEDLTGAQVNVALETLRRLVEKYFLLLNGSSLVVEPVLQMPTRYVFTFPWLPEKNGEGASPS